MHTLFANLGVFHPSVRTWAKKKTFQYLPPAMQTEPIITTCSYAFHLVTIDFNHQEVASINYRSYIVAWEDFNLLQPLDFRG